MTRTSFKQLGIGLLALLAISGWLGYATFLGGAPGIYPLAAWHSLILSPLISLAVLLSFQWWMLLPTIALFVVLFSLYFRRRRLRRAFIALLLWPLLIVVLLPAMIGFFPGQRFAVEPWGQVYRTAYSSLWIDDNYGDVLLFKCDRTGILCGQVHKHPSVVGAADAIPMEYDADSDLLRLGKEPVMYVRSQTETLCSATNTNPYSTTGDGCSRDGKPETKPPS